MGSDNYNEPEQCIDSDTVQTGIRIPPLPKHLQHIERPQIFPLIKAIVLNMDQEVDQWKRIPCAESSMCWGILCGGLVSGYSILRTKSLKGGHYGFAAFVITSIASWNYCRLQLNSSIDVGLQAMHQILEQKHQISNKKDS